MGMVTDGESELDGIQDKINEEILQMMDEERSLICIKWGDSLLYELFKGSREKSSVASVSNSKVPAGVVFYSIQLFDVFLDIF